MFGTIYINPWNFFLISHGIFIDLTGNFRLAHYLPGESVLVGPLGYLPSYTITLRFAAPGDDLPEVVPATEIVWVDELDL